MQSLRAPSPLRRLHDVFNHVAPEERSSETSNHVHVANRATKRPDYRIAFSPRPKGWFKGLKGRLRCGRTMVVVVTKILAPKLLVTHLSDASACPSIGTISRRGWVRRLRDLPPVTATCGTLYSGVSAKRMCARLEGGLSCHVATRRPDTIRDPLDRSLRLSPQLRPIIGYDI